MNTTLALLYGTDVPEEIIKQKQTNKQVRAVAGGSTEAQMTADECKKLCKATANGLEYYPGYEDRVRTYTITDETADRYGDIVRANGAFLDNFKKSPVVQFAHDYSTPPIGNAIKIWKEKNPNCIKAIAVFFGNEIDPSGRCDLIFRFIKANAMPACSIGFSPIKANYPATKEDREKLGLGPYGVEYKEWELLEFSAVPIPANPNALQDEYRTEFVKSLRSGLFTAADVEVLRKEPIFPVLIMDQFIKEIGSPVITVPTEVKATQEDDDEDDMMYECKDCGNVQKSSGKCEKCGGDTKPVKPEKTATIQVEVDTSAAQEAVAELKSSIEDIEKKIESIVTKAKDSIAELSDVAKSVVTASKDATKKRLYDDCFRLIK